LAPRRPVDEALGVRGIGGETDAVTSIEDLVSAAVMHGGRREEGQAAVVVLGVVPSEQRAADLTRMLERAEAVGEVGPVLEGPEVGLREGIVVADVGPRMAAQESRSEKSSATVLLVMADPRSAWTVS
jgi:hypothetical protein